MAVLLWGCQVPSPALLDAPARAPSADSADAYPPGGVEVADATTPSTSDSLGVRHAPQVGILGPGDIVAIKVLGQPELSATVDVIGDGTISLPLAGSVEVAGLSTAAAAARVAQALRIRGIVINPQVTLALAESRSRQVSILGEVRQPGRFPVDTRITVLDALALAGGVTEAGSSVVHILRREGAGTRRYEQDLDALMRAGGAYQPFEIRAGDTVIVPKADQFYIYGAVKAPNSYRLKSGMTVIQALTLAGGLTDRGSDRRVEIRRRDAAGQLRSLAVDLGDLVRPDDIVYVKERFF